MRWGRAVALAAFAAMAASGYACSSTPSEEVGPTVSFGGGSGKGSGGGIGDGAWPDGTHPGGTGGAGGTSGGSGGSTGGKGGAPTGGSGGGSGGGIGGTSPGGSGGTGGSGGGCTPISCMNYTTCQNESNCVASCPGPPGESCNLADDNCNGSCDESANCRVGVNRSYNIASGEHFYTTNPSEAGCCGFSVEIANYYYLYQGSQSGLVGFYRCALANGFHFYTADSNCEGAAGTNEGVMGYIATSAVCGAIPLYRLAASFNNDHLYTTDANERASAQAGGYIDEGVAGYVWTGP